MSAIKKQQLYRSLWDSCDQLRGGMEPSEYKNYILVLLFVKYVSDKYKREIKNGNRYPTIEIPNGCSFDDIIGLRNKKNIGEEINKILEKLFKANRLNDVISPINFDDDKKLGSGADKVELLSKLLLIFQRPEFNFTENTAEGDDILGDAYEYLMKKFASASGKAKGEFYTPAEVSRILAEVLEIDKINKSNLTYYDIKVTKMIQRKFDKNIRKVA